MSAVLVVAAAAGCASSSTSGTGSSTPSTLRVPAVAAASVRTPALLCSAFVDTLLDVSRNKASIEMSAARYQALVDATTGDPEGIVAKIKQLVVDLRGLETGAATETQALDAISAVTRQCRLKGHPFTAAQTQAWRQLFYENLAAATTTVPAP